MAEWPWDKAGTTGGHGQLAGPGAPWGSSRPLLSQISPAIKTQGGWTAKSNPSWELPESSMVRTLGFYWQGPSFNPWSGN